MSHGPGSKAADVAAHYVEAIVAAAEESADLLAEQAARDAEEIRAKAREEADRELDAARKTAIELGQDARRSATREIEEARKEAEQLREQTRRQIEGRVEAAEEAAAQVLGEARTLSSGLRQLGSSLQSQGERILRDVHAAHKRMQADLRIAGPGDEPPRPRGTGATQRRGSDGDETSSSATAEEREALERAAADLRRSRSPRRARQRENAFDDLDVPRWVEG